MYTSKVHKVLAATRQMQTATSSVYRCIKRYCHRSLSWSKPKQTLPSGLPLQQSGASVIWDDRDWDSELQLLLQAVIDPSRPKEGALFLDVGANMGFFTLLAAASGWTAIAVEALPANAQLLDHSLRVNGLSSRATVHNRIVGAPGAAARLCVCRPPGNPSNGILVPPASRRGHPFCGDAPEEECEAAAAGRATLDELRPRGC